MTEKLKKEPECKGFALIELMVTYSGKNGPEIWCDSPYGIIRP